MLSHSVHYVYMYPGFGSESHALRHVHVHMYFKCAISLTTMYMTCTMPCVCKSTARVPPDQFPHPLNLFLK